MADFDSEARIAGDLDAVGRAISHELGGRLRALLLVGGYARGEGSMVMRNGRLSPYNDYDFMVVVSGWRSVRKKLATLSHEWTGKLGVEVELSPLSENSLARLPRTLFWLDVSLGGYELVAGDQQIVAELRNLTPRDIPLEECGRLLANRAVGLALSNLKSTDNDYRKARHAHKAVLACGDALLLAADHYQSTLALRLEAIQRFESAPYVGMWLVAAYHDAVEFRKRPDLWQPAGGDINTWYETTREMISIQHLRFESWRAGAPTNVAAFASWKGRLYPELPDVRPVGTVVSSLRAVAKREASLFPYLGHIRERLARIAVALAYGHQNPASRGVAARLLALRTSEPSDDDLRRALARLVSRGG
ncbi:MAG: hypothetical protein OEQ39_04965 [Gammaproteobacteria bacterium]|nr:hypothetical protein [Gammaproteobacteria bacterium]MDH3464322.1 hypothetical protein [Gammaproteobacteria bacterium]